MSSSYRHRTTWLDTILQDHQSRSSTAGSSRDTRGPTTRTFTTSGDDSGVQRNFQGPENSVTAPQAVMTSQETGAVGIDTAPSLAPVVAGHFRSVVETDANGVESEEMEPARMEYPANATAPETAEEHSIYPMNSEMRKSRIPPANAAELEMRPGPENDWDVRLNLQYHVRRESDRLWAEKHSNMLPTPRPTTATSATISELERSTEQQGDVEESERSPTAREENVDSRKSLGMLMEWDEDADKDFSMFEDTPRDQSILTETEELILPPWDTPEQVRYPSMSALPSMTEWDSENDLAFQDEAREGWSDQRFKTPQTAADIESLQKALEMTRMDFWLRDPSGRYPDDFSQYQTESYASQHRRMQHALCRLWRDVETGDPPELYRLPCWMFGFEECYWKPSSWGFDVYKRANAYNQGLAKMVAEKNERGLQSLDHGEWKARMKALAIPAKPQLA